LIRERFVQICANSGAVRPQLDNSNLSKSWDVQNNASVRLIVPTCIRVAQIRWNVCVQPANINHTWQAKPFKQFKKMERKFTGPMEVPPSRSPDKHEDCASRHSLSTVNLFSFIPVRLSSENLQGRNVILDLLFRYTLVSINKYGENFC